MIDYMWSIETFDRVWVSKWSSMSIENDRVWVWEYRVKVYENKL